MPRIRPPEGHILRALGKVIAAHRRSRGLSQTDLATLVGVGRTTLQYYESGRYWPPLDTLIRIARACDMQLSAFISPLDREDVPDAPDP